MGKRRREKEPGPQGDAEAGEPEEEENWMASDTTLSVLKFRNYAPRDKRLRHFMLEKPKIEASIDLEELCKPLDMTKNGILDIAPKKVNWDLKRDVARKVARLEKRTQRTIIDLIREKVEGQKALEGDDLNDAIENRQKEAQLDSDDD